MPDPTPAIAAGVPVSPEELAKRQLGFALWFYKNDRWEPRTRDERVAFLRAGIALRADKLGEETKASAEQIDAEMLSMWNGTHAIYECQA